jgi:hypothetical protein
MLELNVSQQVEEMSPPTRTRPILISILCGFIILSAGVGLGAILLTLQGYPTAFQLKAAVSNLAVLASAVGLFRMRRWGYWLYLGNYIFFIEFYYLARVQQFDVFPSILFSIVSLVVFSACVLPYWKRLR